MLERTVVDALFKHVERGLSGQSSPMHFWEHVRALASTNAGTDHAPSVGVPVSEYELYFAFAWRFHRDRVRNRPLPFAIASDWRDWCRGSNDSDDRESPRSRRESNEQSAESKPPVAFVVSHSHLRAFAASKSELVGHVCDREGIVNERFLAGPTEIEKATTSPSRNKMVLTGPNSEKKMLALILAQNGAFES